MIGLAIFVCMVAVGVFCLWVHSQMPYIGDSWWRRIGLGLLFGAAGFLVVRVFL